MLKFETKSAACSVAFYDHYCPSDMPGSRPYLRHTAFRVIKESNGYWRADWCDAVAGTWLPWEPVTTVDYPSAGSARKAIRAAVKAGFPKVR